MGNEAPQFLPIRIIGGSLRQISKPRIYRAQNAARYFAELPDPLNDLSDRDWLREKIPDFYGLICCCSTPLFLREKNVRTTLTVATNNFFLF